MKKSTLIPIIAMVLLISIGANVGGWYRTVCFAVAVVMATLSLVSAIRKE
ncbi:MAG: hypothetical protein RSA63_01225 [Eubacterium sp.]